MEGQPSTSKCKPMSVFGDDNPEEAKQEITDAVNYCLDSLQRSK
jgi:hypothetical protein